MSAAAHAGGDRFWLASEHRWATRIGPGEWAVSTEGETIVTVLGSCVSACMFDPVRRVGGMNHFMLPDDAQDGPGSASARYGGFAMEALVNGLLARGARRGDLVVKLVGGGRMWRTSADIGRRNAEFARAWLATEGYRLADERLGFPQPVRVHFHSDDGVVHFKRLASVERTELERQESAYERQITTTKGVGTVELF